MAIRTDRQHDGAVARIVLDRPKANVLDAEMVDAISDHLTTLTDPELKLVVFEGEGRHFSFGASVEEHLPDQVRLMLTRFHTLFRTLEATGIPTASVVRGQCLGGGCELALATGRIFASPDATFALPEIKLGVFPPLGAVLLPLRLGHPRATSAVLSGGSIPDLADETADDPEAALQAWYAATLADKSAPAVRYAWQALRVPVRRALNQDLAAAEGLYLDGLMRFEDPVEGLSSFLEKRAPQWRHA